MKTMRSLALAAAAVMALAALFLASDAGQASHATFSVDSTGDAADAAPGDGVCATAGAVCTLRAAIQEANAHAGTDTINFSISGTIVLGSTLPNITDPAGLTIDGTGQSITVSGNNSVPVMIVDPGATLNLQDATIANGHGGIFNDGGGIFNRGTLALTDSTVSGNQAFRGSGIRNDGTLTVINSNISGNSTGNGTGGGIFNTGTLALNNSTVSGNVADSGAGIWNESGLEVTITNSTVSSNSTSGFGAGIRNEAGTLTLTNSTVSSNGAGTGGGISNSGTLTLINSTVNGNSPGGGVWNGGVASLKNTIVANSPSPGNCHGPNSFTSLGHNLSSDGTCAFAATGDLNNTNPMLGPLANNGGPTQTHFLLSGSPAIDAGDNVDCPASDQRGVARPQDGDGNGSAICDIGALEHEAPLCLDGDRVCSSAPTTSRLSVSTSGEQANGASYAPDIGINFPGPFSPSLNPARFVALVSDASNLVPGDTNGQPDVFVVDRLTGTVEGVSVNNAGQLVGVTGACAAGDCATVTADGHYVSFITAAAVAPGDANGLPDFYVRDRQAGTTILVSKSTAGVVGNGAALRGALSKNPHAVFSSEANNLVAGDTNGVTDVFVNDLQTGVTSRVSVASDGSQLTSASDLPAISPDARFAGFITAAAVAPEDSNGLADFYVRDQQAGTTILASKSTAGVVGNGAALRGSLSRNPHAVFVSEATNLVEGDGNGVPDVFVHALLTGVTTRASVASGGAEAGGPSDFPSMSGESPRCVAFLSSAANLVAGDTNGAPDVFVHDRVTGTTIRASLAQDGSQISGVEGPPVISTDCRHVAFASADGSVVPEDSNGLADIFLRDLGDTDGDHEPDPFDPCPSIVDCDGDGGLDGMERHAGTSPTLFCSADTTPDNEEPDARLTDLNDDQSVSGADLSAIAGSIGQAVPPGPVRKDIAPDPAGDNAISGADLSRVAGAIGTSCTP